MSQSSVIEDQDQKQKQNDFYGWQLLYYSIRESLCKKSDLLIALAHFLITKQYNLRIVDAEEGKSKQSPRQLAGCNDQNDANNNKIGLNGSELLPENWNRDAQKYSLHYMDEINHRYVLLAKLTRKDLVINLQNWTTKRMSITCLQPNLLVCSTHSSDLANCIPQVNEILLHMRKDLVDPVVRGTRKINAISGYSIDKLSTNFKDIDCQTVGDEQLNHCISQKDLVYSVQSESDDKGLLNKSVTTMAVYQSLKSITSLESI